MRYLRTSGMGNSYQTSFTQETKKQKLYLYEFKVVSFLNYTSIQKTSVRMMGNNRSMYYLKPLSGV